MNRDAWMVAAAVFCFAPMAGGQCLPQWVERLPAHSPTARWQHVSGFDSWRGVVLIYGGLDGPGTGPADLWRFDGVDWARRAGEGPGTRLNAGAAFDHGRGRFVLHGGASDSGRTSRETWEWNDEQWSLAAIRLDDLFGPELAYQAGLRRIVMTGGQSASPTTTTDTWTWDGVAWSEAPLSHDLHRRWDLALAYDAARDRVVLFGGQGLFRGYLYPLYFGDTWEWDGVTWTRVATDGPAARYGHAMAYDPHRQRVILFGGTVDATETIVYFDDTWEWDGTRWTQLLVAGPSKRAHHSMVYDSLRSRMVVFGGRNAEGALSDTWELVTGASADCRPDLSCDGVVDFGDLLEFLNLYEGGDPRVDFTGDGLLDFADYLAFLELYGAGC